MLVGYFFAPYLNSFMAPVVDTFRNRVEVGEIKLTVSSIFSNNLFVAIVLYFGAIIFGLLTAMILISNGLFIGFFATSIPLDYFLLLTLPHGIFEISAIIIVGAAAFSLLLFLVYFFRDIINTKINQWGEKPGFKDRIAISYNDNHNKLFQSLILLGIGIGLLIIATFIEVYVTVGFASFIMGLY